MAALEDQPDTGYGELTAVLLGIAPTDSQRAKYAARAALEAKGSVATYWNHNALWIDGRFVQAGKAIRRAGHVGTVTGAAS